MHFRAEAKAQLRRSRSPSFRAIAAKPIAGGPVKARYRRPRGQAQAIWQPRNRNWLSSRRRIRLPLSIEMPIRVCKNRSCIGATGLQASTTADQQAAVVAASKRRVESSQGALTTAEASLSNPGIRESQVVSVRRQIAQQEAEVASATALTQQARAELAEAGDNRKDLTIRPVLRNSSDARRNRRGVVAELL